MKVYEVCGEKVREDEYSRFKRKRFGVKMSLKFRFKNFK